MPYQHAWYTPDVLSEKKFSQLSKDVAKVCDYAQKQLKIKLYGAVDETDVPPAFTEDSFYFCGRQSTMTFGIHSHHGGLPEENGLYFDYVETNKEPFDIAVCMSLILLLYHFPECRLRSDGTVAEWSKAWKLVQYLFVDYNFLPYAPYATIDEMKAHYEKTKDKRFPKLILEAWKNGQEFTT